MKYTNALKEVTFALPGVKTQEIKFRGETVYTSNILKTNIKKVSKKYFSLTISSKVNHLINMGKIIPVFKSKNIVDYLSKKRKIKTHSLATTSDGKIYLFLDNFYSLLKLSTLNEKKLSKIILHELIHVVEHDKPKEFNQINFKIFVDFFKEFFERYLSVKNIKNTDIVEVIKRINYAKKIKVVNFVKIYFPLFEILEKRTSLPELEYKKERYPNFINYLDKSFESFIKTVPSDIWKSGQKAYIKIAGGKNETLAQEFWEPAEIICILSEINPKHPNISKTISIL